MDPPCRRRRSCQERSKNRAQHIACPIRSRDGCDRSRGSHWALGQPWRWPNCEAGQSRGAFVGALLPYSTGEWVLYLLFFAVSFVYVVAFVATKGQILGKLAAGIQVVRANTGMRTGTPKSLARWALPGLLVTVPVLGWLISFLCYLSPTWGTNRQGWHDKVAKTLVVVR